MTQVFGTPWARAIPVGIVLVMVRRHLSSYFRRPTHRRSPRRPECATPVAVISARGVSKDFLLPHLRLQHDQELLRQHVSRADGSWRCSTRCGTSSFTIKAREVFGICHAAHQSGKSISSRSSPASARPTSGHVSVGGRLVPFIELGVGFNAELAGRENVYLNGAMMGFSKAEVDEIYDDVVAFAELEEYMDQKLKNSSSGMQVRIAFSLATRAKGDILLVDEVLAVGDAAFQRKCFEYFRTLKSGGHHRRVRDAQHGSGARVLRSRHPHRRQESPRRRRDS